MITIETKLKAQKNDVSEQKKPVGNYQETVQDAVGTVH
jgi:hypothetical protein